jgi:pimeloyl-ACP methyl ester carboxylesterase
MENLRRYGNPPFNIAVIHGGPGAPGSAAPVARELALTRGVLEPLQTEETVEGEVQELRTVLEESAELPVILIGHSWGAMLSYIVAARYPSLVKKLIMIASGVFEEKYADSIDPVRWTRLSETERIEVSKLIDSLSDPANKNKNLAMARLGQLWAKSDSYDPISLNFEMLEARYEININVWAGAKILRNSGQLLEMGKRIRCPVAAIQGDYDAHPAEGIREPLTRAVKDFRFILLEKCGHYPWMERQARDKFYEVLKREIE